MSFGSSGPSALEQIGAQRSRQVEAENAVALQKATEERDAASKKKDGAQIMFGGRSSTALASANAATQAQPVGLQASGKTFLGS